MTHSKMYLSKKKIKFQKEVSSFFCQLPFPMDRSLTPMRGLTRMRGSQPRHFPADLGRVSAVGVREYVVKIPLAESRDQNEFIGIESLASMNSLPRVEFKPGSKSATLLEFECAMTQTARSPRPVNGSIISTIIFLSNFALTLKLGSEYRAWVLFRSLIYFKKQQHDTNVHLIYRLIQ